MGSVFTGIFFGGVLISSTGLHCEIPPKTSSIGFLRLVGLPTYVVERDYARLITDNLTFR